MMVDLGINDTYKLNDNAYVIDSTTTKLCLSIFWWPSYVKSSEELKHIHC